MTEPRKTRIVFICIGNMCRSPMAEGFARHLGGDLVEVYSAGTHPTGVVSEDSIYMMDEIDIDISHQRSNSLKSVPLEEMDIAVSMAPDSAASLMPPGFKGRAIDWMVVDPISSSLKTFRRVRDEIEALVRELLDEIRSEKTPS
jgi:arsenate reductase